MQAHFKENAQQFRLKREHLQFYLFSKCCFGMLWKGISQRALCLSLGLWDLHLNKCSIFNEQIHHFLGSLCPLFSWKRPQSMQTLTLAPLSPVGFQGAHNLLMQSCVLIQHNPTLRRLNFQSKALWRWIHPRQTYSFCILGGGVQSPCSAFRRDAMDALWPGTWAGLAAPVKIT